MMEKSCFKDDKSRFKDDNSHFKDDWCYRIQGQPGVPSKGLVCPGDCVHESSFREDHFK